MAGRAGHRGRRRAEHVRRLVGAARTSRAGFASVRFAASGSAPLSASILHRYTEAGLPALRGLRPDRGRAGDHHQLVGDRGARSPVRSDGRCPASRSSCAIPTANRSRTATPASCSSAGRTCSRATGPTARDGPDADGWFRTTDIAALDDDGDLQLIGRTSDLVIVSGFNVYPAEVEAVLRAIDGIDEVAVIGVPDEQTGEAVVAYVVRRARRRARRRRACWRQRLARSRDSSCRGR